MTNGLPSQSHAMRLKRGRGPIAKCEHCEGPMPKMPPSRSKIQRFCCRDCRFKADGRVVNPIAFDAGLCDECCERPRKKDGVYCGKRCQSKRRRRMRRHNRTCIVCEERRVARGRKNYCDECTPDRNKHTRKVWRLEWLAKPETKARMKKKKATPKVKAQRRESQRRYMEKNRDAVNARNRERRAKDKADGVKDEYSSDPWNNSFRKFYRMVHKMTERYQRLGKTRPVFFTKSGWDDSWMSGFESPEKWFEVLWDTEHNRQWMEAHGCTHRLTVERDERGFPVDYFYEDGEPRVWAQAVCRYHLHHIIRRAEFKDEMNAAVDAGDTETFKRLFNEANHPDNMVYITEHEHYKIHEGEINLMRGHNKEPPNQPTISEEGEINNDC